MGKKVVWHYVPGAPFPRSTEPGAHLAELMNDAEITRRALADPDNPPINPKDFHKFKRVNPLAKSNR